MEEIIAKIKGYALVIDPSLSEETLLDYTIGEIVDRALVYTNRGQLVADYEEGNIDEVPIPVELERPLAKVVAMSIRAMRDNPEGGVQVKSISDNGQSITYGDSPASYLSSQGDADIFSSIKAVVDKFRIPIIVENT